MSLGYEVFSAPTWAQDVAVRIAGALPSTGTVVLTGGSAARAVYPELAALGSDWSGIEVFWSDERCVPPDHPESNYRMARELLLTRVKPGAVHRMHGELDPEHAARLYHEELVASATMGLDLLLLGMGADCHIGAMFPGSAALTERERLCEAVERPDGMRGLTLTPPPMQNATRILLLVKGEAKAGAVKRVLDSDEHIDTCPARLLKEHRDATFLLDEAAAAELG